MREGSHALRREPRRWRTSFGRWVTSFGVTRLAVELSGAGQPVTRHAIYQWVAGVTAPRPERAVRIVELSRGLVHLADIYRQREMRSAR
jgi:hypothetical protein